MFRHLLHRSACSRNLCSNPSATKSFIKFRSPNFTVPPHQLNPVSPSRFGSSLGSNIRATRPFMMHSTSSCSAAKQVVSENKVQQIELLDAINDDYGGVVVDIKESMNSEVFVSLLRASMLRWREEGKTGVWIKLPIGNVNLVEAAVKEGFCYHHAEPDYVMVVYWIPKTASTLPANASHRVGIGAFVMNIERKVLVVQEKSGKFKGTGVWKLPTGVVNEGEDICDAASREVKEETGIDTEFVEVLAFSQSHKSPSIFGKSDLFFVCMLRPLSSEIQRQDSEIEAAQWMPVEDYVSQPFVQKHEHFKCIADLCLTKLDKDYAGFAAVPTKTRSGKTSYVYLNKKDL